MFVDGDNSSTSHSTIHNIAAYYMNGRMGIFMEFTSSWNAAPNAIIGNTLCTNHNDGITTGSTMDGFVKTKSPTYNSCWLQISSDSPTSSTRRAAPLGCPNDRSAPAQCIGAPLPNDRSAPAQCTMLSPKAPATTPTGIATEQGRQSASALHDHPVRSLC